MSDAWSIRIGCPSCASPLTPQATPRAEDWHLEVNHVLACVECARTWLVRMTITSAGVPPAGKMRRFPLGREHHELIDTIIDHQRATA